MNISLHFEGGLDTLFGNQKTIKISDLAPNTSIASLLRYIGKNLIKDRIELFLAGNIAESPSLRPGILCLINDEDWELNEQEKYIIQEGDEIIFISTLHGG